MGDEEARYDRDDVRHAKFFFRMVEGEDRKD